ncbi:MAG: endolytic transglycosylase MltG [Syntrophomonadaceae bacterium]|nr:endolytic transglycosylase MltG [Syntrophomonadaceae bacterium]
MGEVKVLSEKRLMLAVALLGIVILAWMSFRQVSQMLAPINPGDHRPVEVVVPANASTYKVADILYGAGLIRNQSIFVNYCRLTGTDQRLKAGVYSFRRSQALPELVDDLVSGRVLTVGFTVPEGYDLRQIGELLVREGICNEEEWRQAIVQDYDYPFLKQVPPRPNRLEGFLFPDTYRVTRDVTARQVVELMLQRFEKEWETRFAAEARALGKDVYQVITLASLVEKEARVPAERPIIAGVLVNRLQKGMPLQVDATVLYSLGQHKSQITYADLNVASPYNTYRVPGLPPGPIASPGAASIEAALHPAQHSYYYYVYMGDGRHYFSKTYAEHVRAKQKYLKN